MVEWVTVRGNERVKVNPRRDVKGKGVGKLDYIDSEIAVDCLANTCLFISEELRGH